jgi:predicted O-linked N-acetylglucosamine transferase (SPINDLY family)
MNRQQRRADAKAKTKIDPAGAVIATAVQHHLCGELQQAATLYSKVLKSNPRHADANHLLGVIAYQLGQNQLAVDLIGTAIAVNKLDPAFHSNLGNALLNLGRLHDALAAYDTALRLNANYADAHNNRGNVLKALDRLDDAVDAYDTALHLKPNYVEAHNNQGSALFELTRFDHALAAFDHAIALDPNYADAHNNRGSTLRDMGRLDDALAAFDTALRIRPCYADAHSNKLLSLHYVAFDAGSDIAAQARAFGACVSHTNAFRSFANTAIPNRRLRIGYVSGDWRRHPVGYFMQSILRNHDPNAVEVFCYSNNLKDDDLTEYFESRADHWRSLRGLTDEAAATLIRADAIDILVDLSGHTGHNRLPLFAHRPAAVQISWLGYFGTTGLTTMDYVLADRFVVPIGEEHAYTEQVWRMPNSYLCFMPPDWDIPVQCRDVQAPITFGSFNNLTKLSSHTVRLWSQVLHRVPQSRLLLKTRQLADAAACQTVQQRFAQHGIQPHRLVLEGPALRADLLASYNRVDIALDPYPYGGGTTTAEALWMGTPVVTLQGSTWTGRVSESILSTVGLTDLVADSQDAYVELAVKLAGNGEWRAHLHATLRSCLESSPFCDGVGFTRQLEDAYRSMWKRWCEDEVL